MVELCHKSTKKGEKMEYFLKYSINSKKAKKKKKERRKIIWDNHNMTLLI